MNPHFKKLVKAARTLNIEVIDRCNLTIFFSLNLDMKSFQLSLQKTMFMLVASLPCYTKDNVDKQRGRGVFDKSITALEQLNALGYGKTESGLNLDLVYNPGGAFLPGNQKKLEADYKKELKELFRH